MLKSVTSYFKGKTPDELQKIVDDLGTQLEELRKENSEDIPKDKEIEKIEKDLKTAEENLKKAQEKEENMKIEKNVSEVKKKAFKEAIANQAEAEENKADKIADEKARVIEEQMIKVLGGFFVYRAKPTGESKRIKDLSQAEGDFAQKGEITGMVLIKESGDRQFMTYAPIDSTTYTVDKFMEYFKDTMYNNKYDDSVDKVFELEALGTLVNKLIVQTVEEPVAAIDAPVAAIDAPVAAIDAPVATKPVAAPTKPVAAPTKPVAASSVAASSVAAPSVAAPSVAAKPISQTVSVLDSALKLSSLI